MEDLSNEVVAQIVRHLNPRDILSLGQVRDQERDNSEERFSDTYKVSRRLNALTSERNVWIYALTSMCQDNGLFLTSFAIEDMDLLQLQRCALGPWLWDRKLLAYYRASISDSKTEALQPVSWIPAPPTLLDDAEKTYLVPGGRFLFTVINAFSDGVNLRIHDLGHAGRLRPDPTIVSQVTLQPDSSAEVCDNWVHEIDVFILDEKTLRVAIGLTYEMEDGSSDLQCVVRMGPHTAHLLTTIGTSVSKCSTYAPTPKALPST